MAQSEATPTSEIFEVEWIEKKRIDARGVRYYIKWKDYAESENTWEPIEHLNCKDLVEEFEKRCELDPSLVTDLTKRKKRNDDALRGGGGRIRKPSNKSGIKTNQIVPNGHKIDNGPVAEYIIGATNLSGELMFLIKWKDRNEAALVDAMRANAKYPQMVIDYLTPKIADMNDENEDREESED